MKNLSNTLIIRIHAVKDILSSNECKKLIMDAENADFNHHLHRAEVMVKHRAQVREQVNFM